MFSRGIIPTEEGFANAVLVFANCRVSNEAFKLLKRWKKETAGTYLSKNVSSPYKWPGIKAVNALLDALAHDTDEMRNSADLEKTLQRLVNLLELSISMCTKDTADLLCIGEQLKSNRLLLKLKNSEKNSLKLWTTIHRETFDAIKKRADMFK